ncbi:MAG: hypothetical protein ABSG53_14030 [Thermoguttaceae bacterium]|jgi:hypothetical protein
MNDYQRCWWEQAQSDHGALIAIRRQGAAPCHHLHYLQMVTEKLSKAYFWRSGAPPRKSHAGFGLFMRLLQQIPQSRRQRIADIFGFGRFEDFQNWARTALPLVYALEKLAPALAKDGPNPEYPWPQNAPQFVPATFDFDVWRQLTETGRGRQLVQVIKAAVEQFPVYV